jgi:hypothetical protein
MTMTERSLEELKKEFLIEAIKLLTNLNDILENAIDEAEKPITSGHLTGIPIRVEKEAED